MYPNSHFDEISTSSNISRRYSLQKHHNVDIGLSKINAEILYSILLSSTEECSMFNYIYVLYKPSESIWIKIQAMNSNNKKNQQLKDQCSQIGFNRLLKFIYISGMPFSIHGPTLIENKTHTIFMS